MGDDTTTVKVQETDRLIGTRHEPRAWRTSRNANQRAKWPSKSAKPRWHSIGSSPRNSSNKMREHLPFNQRPPSPLPPSLSKSTLSSLQLDSPIHSRAACPWSSRPHRPQWRSPRESAPSTCCCASTTDGQIRPEAQLFLVKITKRDASPRKTTSGPFVCTCTARPSSRAAARRLLRQERPGQDNDRDTPAQILHGCWGIPA